MWKLTSLVLSDAWGDWNEVAMPEMVPEAFAPAVVWTPEDPKWAPPPQPIDVVNRKVAVGPVAVQVMSIVNEGGRPSLVVPSHIGVEGTIDACRVADCELNVNALAGRT